MTIRLFSVVCGLALLGFAPGLPGAEEKSGKEKEDAVFELKEVSAFNVSPGRSPMRGQSVVCSTEPDKAVKAYPKLKSKHPLYGKLQFDRSLANRKGVAIHFVLDESGETPFAEEKKDQERAKNGEKKPRPVDPKLSSYDRLYFDSNRDGDLTNDPVLKPMKDPPWKSLPGFAYKERMAFELAGIDVDYGAGIGVRPFRVFPWFTLGQGQKYPAMRFAAAVAYKGTIKIGNDEYDALLAQEYAISGRFDRPSTSLRLTPKDGQTGRASFGFDAQLLMNMRRSGDRFYTLAAAPLGDKLTVKPYRGALGVFQVGPGYRKLKDFSFQGSFRSETASLSMGPDRSTPADAQKKIGECKLPVGDYLPSYLMIEYGKLEIGVSDNYHAEGRPRDLKRRRTYGIHIREDKPFVLDFSNKPAVLFASPATDKPVKPGDEVRVAAVLIDPVLNIMIRRLTDTSQSKKETIRHGSGKDAEETVYERPLSLDPLVTIADSSGKSVAEGPMPFG